MFCHLRRHVLSPKMCQIWCTACTFCHNVVTKCAERSTRCTFCHSFTSNTITCFPFLIVCVYVRVCVCARAHVCVFVCARANVCVCVCVDVHLSVAARVFVALCLLSPPQSALNWNSVLLWVDHKATAARSSVSCVKYDYRYRDLSENVAWLCCGCPCLIEWLAWFDEIKGKRGLTLGVTFHSMQRLVHFVA